MVQVQGQAGEQTASDGSVLSPQLARLAELVVTELQGRHFQNNYRGRTYHAANQAGQALSLLSATFTGIALWNPPSSGVYAVIEEAGLGLTAVPTGESAVLLFFFTASPTAFTTQIATVPGKPATAGSYPTASAAGKISAWSSLTLAAAPGAVTAPIIRALASILFGTSVGVQHMAPVKDELAGLLILPPGTGCGLCAVTTAITGIGHFSWEELPSPPF